MGAINKVADLTPDQAEQAKKMVWSGPRKAGARAIAKKMGWSETAVRRALGYQTWKDWTWYRDKLKLERVE